MYIKRAGLVILLVILIASCAKEDTIAPVLSLNLGNNIAMSLPRIPGTNVWTDPGFYAKDNKDGVITNQVKVFGTVNPNLKGIYTLTYSVKDAAGNVTTQNRVVNVFNDADSLAGTYTVIDSTVTGPSSPAWTSYVVILTTDNTTDSVIHFDKFAGFFNDSTVIGRANRLAATINIAKQTVTFTPSATPVTHVFSGAGTDSVGALIQTALHLTYTDSNKTANTLTIHHTRWTH
jgi:hypothetical protein